MQKMGPGGPKWGRGEFIPTNPDLADILGRTDFDFENFHFLDFFWVPNFWLGPSLGPAWAHPLGPSVGPPTWAPRGPTHLGPRWAHPLGPTHLGPAWAHPLIDCVTCEYLCLSTIDFVLALMFAA